MKGRNTLGRGLASLIPEAREELDSPRAALASGAVVQIPIDEVKANPMQPRRRFNAETLAELTASIHEQGIIQPILLRPKDGTYEIVAGERRYRAACKAGLRTVPAIIRRVDRAESLEIALIENIMREDLNPVDEAAAYRDLIEEFGYTQEELSRRVGKDRSTISNQLRLLKLPEEILDALSRGAVTMGHGRALLGLHEAGADADRAIGGTGTLAEDVDHRLRSHGWPVWPVGQQRIQVVGHGENPCGLGECVPGASPMIPVAIETLMVRAGVGGELGEGRHLDENVVGVLRMALHDLPVAIG